MGFLDNIFGSHSDREIKRMMPIITAVEKYADQMAALSETDLQAQTARLKSRLADGESLDDILPEAFATVREASRRVLEMSHFKVQLIGGIVLHQGRIAEMKTGEGKTLVATLPVYLNALTGQRRARGHSQRLPGRPRQRMDGQDLPLPGPVGRTDRPWHEQ